MACIYICALIAFNIYVIRSQIGVISIVMSSCHFVRRHLLHLVEFSRAYKSLVFVNEVGIDVAIIPISFVYDAHVARNFALDALIRLALHLSFFFDFFRSLLHIVDRAADYLSLLIFLDMFVDESLLIAGPQAHSRSLFAG